MDEIVKRKAKGSGARTANNLTHEQAARLRSWCDTNRTWASEHTAKEIVSRLMLTWPFVVTESNVNSTRKALGIVKPTPVAPGECKCRELAAAIFGWVVFDIPHAEYISRIRDIAGIKPKPATTEPLPFAVTREGAA